MERLSTQDILKMRLTINKIKRDYEDDYVHIKDYYYDNYNPGSYMLMNKKDNLLIINHDVFCKEEIKAYQFNTRIDLDILNYDNDTIIKSIAEGINNCIMN